MTKSKFVLVAPENCQRARAFQTALSASGQPKAIQVTYLDLISDSFSPSLFSEKIIRLESPGRDPLTYAALLQLGLSQAEELGMKPTLSLGSYTKGEIINPLQWYFGFRAIMNKLTNLSAQVHNCRFLSNPADVSILFRKSLTHQRFTKRRIPVPKSIGPVHHFSELLHCIKPHKRKRFFLKLDMGSAASGIMALAFNKNGVFAYSTIELTCEKGKTRLYNSRKLQRYTNTKTIATIVNTLCDFGIHVEQWIPKMGIDKYVCDMRVVTMGGRTTHYMLRKAKGPFTNLHLKNERDSVDRLHQKIGNKQWNYAVSICEQAAGVFSDTYSLGLDLAFSTTGNPYILEANAFGDYIKGFKAGDMTPYEQQVKQLSKC